MRQTSAAPFKCWPRLMTGIAFSLCATFSHAADTDKVITWMAMDLPPALMIVDGQLTNGFVDNALKMIFAEFPGVQHRFALTPTARAWNNLARGIPMCFLTPLRTKEREAIAFFTSTQLISPVQLLAREDIVDRLPRNAEGEVLLDVLIQQSRLRGLIIPRRSYTQDLDNLLRQRGAQSAIREVVAVSGGSNLLQMISLGRADYTLEFDYVRVYDELHYPQLRKGAGLKSLPIAGTQPQVAGIACPRTAWGRDMIMRLDAIVARISQRREYQAASDLWLTPDTIKRYRKAQTDFYRKRAHRTDDAEYALGPPA